MTECDAEDCPSPGPKGDHNTHTAVKQENAETNLITGCSTLEKNSLYSDLFTLVFGHLPAGEQLSSSYSNNFTEFPFDHECFGQVTAFQTSEYNEDNPVSNNDVEESGLNQTEPAELIIETKPRFKFRADDISSGTVATGKQINIYSNT